MFEGTKLDDITLTVGGESVLTWEFIDYLREEDKKIPNPYNVIPQKGCQEEFLSSNADIVIYGGKRGAGKLQPNDSRILTPKGWDIMGNLKIGSVISTPFDGNAAVTDIFPQGKKEVYTLTTSDGRECECGLEHLWTVRTSKMLHNYHVNGNWNCCTVKSTAELINGMENGKAYYLPIPKAIEFDEKQLPIHPYVLGVMIGDGWLTNKTKRNCFFISNTEHDIIEKVFRLSDAYKVHSSKSSCTKSIYTKHISEYVSYLKEKGLNTYSYNKYIPSEYLFSSITQRKELLCGLFDTDGSIGKKNRYSYSTTSERLKDDVVSLCRSLGYIAKVNCDKRIGKYTKGRSYEITISTDEIIFSSKKHFLRYDSEYNSKRKYAFRNDHVRIVSIKKSRTAECRCILVDTPKHLYVTNDFIVTHNSFGLLSEAVKDNANKHFNAVIFRKEINDLTTLEDESGRIYNQLGTYNRSKNDMTWNFDKGSSVKLTYYSGSFQDFKARFQGQEIPYIGIDEITQMEYDKFKYIMTDSRNSFFIPNRLYGTCNPDPDSWVAKFIDWWIGDDGYPIHERSGVIRYCFMGGDDSKDPAGISWGNTRQEVYENNKELIDTLYLPFERLELGMTKQEMFIKSVTFIEGRLEENIQLLRSSPEYVSNLANQSLEDIERDLRGNWKYKSVGDDLINYANMESFFKNEFQYGDKKRRASCDVAFDGGDNLVMWLWIGNHIQDIFTCSASSRDVLMSVRNKLEEWRVLDEDFTYDLSGIGQSFKGFFPNAVPFNNREAVDDKYKGQYDNIKSQCCYLFYHALNDGEISINPDLLDMKFSGKDYKSMALRDILMRERKAIKKDINQTDKGFCIIKKIIMKQVVGHSPDFIEAMMMKFIFNIKQKNKRKIIGAGWL